MVQKIVSSSNTPELRKILILSNSRGHLTSLYSMLKDLKLERNGKLVTFGYYWGLATNGETGLHEKCLCPIPEIVKKKNKLEFNLKSKQQCIFNQQPNSPFCLFHQYLNTLNPNIANNFDSYRICGNSMQTLCYNYFISLDNQKICPSCLNPNKEANKDNNKDNLLELVKLANLKKSTKTRYREMLETSKQCDIILGTNGIASEALNIPGLNTLIQGTPQQAVEQTVGRILRKQSVDNTNPPLIIDLVVNHSRVRTKTYKTEGFRHKIMPKLNLDDNPVDKFCWQYFDQLIRDHSFGKVNNENDKDSDSDDNDSSSDDGDKELQKCLL